MNGRQLDHYIDGAWRPADGGGRIPVINPTTEATVGFVPDGTAADVDTAVAAAQRALPQWSRVPVAKRADVLRAIAKLVTHETDRLAALETQDMGKPIDESKWDMEDVAACFEYYADVAVMELGPENNALSEIEVPMEEFTCGVMKQPVGVVGLITPWNYPSLMATWKMAPALAAGCTVVLKPSEHASWTCLLLAEMATRAGLPPGVLNVVAGYGSKAGAALVGHPGVHKVSFTGSNATGRHIAAAAASRLAPVTLELGGKSALIVFDDVDIEHAVEWAMFGCFWTNGQICSATSRLLVHERITPRFLERLVARAQSIHVSDPMDPPSRLGPLVCESQYNKVLKYIESGVKEGAKLLTGGGRPKHLSRGFFVAPTVFSDVCQDMTIWREEIFGPVLAVMTFSSEAEAVRLANGSPYGLAGAVISKDKERCRRVAAALDCGIVWVNCSQPCFCQAPWGGRKQSGIGRDLGVWGLNNYLSVKQVTEYVSHEMWDWYPTAISKVASKL